MVGKYHDKEFIASDPEREVSLLHRVFSLLPNLTEVKVLVYQEHESVDHVPSWFLIFVRELREGQDTERESYESDRDRCKIERSATAVVMRAMAQASSRCQVLDVRAVDHGRTGGLPVEQVPSLLGLRRICIRFQQHGLVSGEVKRYRNLKCHSLATAFAHGIRHSAYLESIEEHGGGGLCEDNVHLIQCLVEVRSSFDRLRRLHLQRVTMNDYYLRRFLAQHRGALQELSLKTVELDHETDGPTS